MKTLHLVLKKKWFDMILSGEKKEEYRENTGYWFNRLNADSHYYRCQKCNPKSANCPSCGFFIDKFSTPINFKEFDAIEFRNGYATAAPKFLIECKGIELTTGHTGWGAVGGEKYFVIRLGEILSSSNINQ
jgi:hypothetical protein